MNKVSLEGMISNIEVRPHSLVVILQTSTKQVFDGQEYVRDVPVKVHVFDMTIVERADAIEVGSLYEVDGIITYVKESRGFEMSVVVDDNGQFSSLEHEEEELPVVNMNWVKEAPKQTVKPQPKAKPQPEPQAQFRRAQPKANPKARTQSQHKQGPAQTFQFAYESDVFESMNIGRRRTKDTIDISATSSERSPVQEHQPIASEEEVPAVTADVAAADWENLSNKGCRVPDVNEPEVGQNPPPEAYNDVPEFSDVPQHLSPGEMAEQYEPQQQ